MAVATTAVDSDDSDDEDHYNLLGVPPTARLIEIKKAFRLLQRKVHPDSSKTADTRHISALLNKAYQILSNPLCRLEYDLHHGFKEKNFQNLSKLQECRRRKAQKMRENMSASANRSRDIESKNCGLIISNAKYGFVELENKQKADINTGYDSETESVVLANHMHSLKDNGDNTKEHTVDVTDALQCMVTHRGQCGGYIEIEDGFDKSRLDGFYHPNSTENNVDARELEVEYIFNTKYHYIRANNFEYVCLPNEAHIVHICDGKTPYKYTETLVESEDDFSGDEENKMILQSAHSFATFSPNFMCKYGALSVPPETIHLPSGRTAIQSRPSLGGLKKFSEISKARQAEHNKNRNVNVNVNSGHNHNARYQIIKWSIAIFICGAIGGLGYYYVDKSQREQHQKQQKNSSEDNNSNVWRESLISYVQRYWNGIVVNNIDDNDKTE